MLEKLDKFKKKAAHKKGLSHLTPQEQIFKNWHQILLAYVIANIVFVIISVFVISGLGASLGADDNDVSTNNGNSFTSDSLVESIQPQRFKALVKQGVLWIDPAPDF